MAKEKGLSLEHLSGSGEQGRIVKRDVENLANQVAKPGLSTSYVAPAQQGDREVINSQMRKTIARRLSESKFTAPHFYLTTEVDMDACVEARNQLNAVSPQKYLTTT